MVLGENQDLNISFIKNNDEWISEQLNVIVSQEELYQESFINLYLNYTIFIYFIIEICNLNI